MKYFQKIAQVYDRVRGRELRDPVLKLFREVSSRGSLVVDVACGTALYSLPLVEKLKLRLVGVDLCRDMLEAAAQKGRSLSPRPSFVVADVHHLPFKDRAFEHALSTNAVHHFDLESAFSEIARVARDKVIIYSRLRSQNDRSVWAEYFPKFAEKENRLLERKDFAELAEMIPALELEGIRELSFKARAKAWELIARARAKKFSTFEMYGKEEFEKCLKTFEERLRGMDGIKYKKEIAQVVYSVS